MMATDSIKTVPSSRTKAGTAWLGLIFKNSYEFCSPLAKLMYLNSGVIFFKFKAILTLQAVELLK